MLLRRIWEHGERLALVGADGASHTYRNVYHLAKSVSQGLGKAVQGRPVGIFAPYDVQFVVGALGAWDAKGILTPIHNKYPAREIAYILADTKAPTVLTSSSLHGRIAPSAAAGGTALSLLPEASDVTQAGADERSLLPHFQEARPEDPALILYTSGTTGPPKGVLHTHGSVGAMVEALVDAWEWQAADRVLHYLPLHHVHGLVNKLLCALHVGATVEFTGGSSPQILWPRLARAGEQRRSGRASEAPSVFMAVPTIYARLLEAAESGQVRESDLKSAQSAIEALRLQVSGSAALPDDVAARWRRLAGGRPLLERYGMTEVGMALSQPLRPEEARIPGFVGMPLPGVQVRVVADEDDAAQPPKAKTSSAASSTSNGGKSSSSSSSRPGETKQMSKRPAPVGVDAPVGSAGELRLKGPAVFREYWGRPEATVTAFDEGGWFRTGDVASYDPAVGAYRIHGRASADIIKSGGYKISALDVERALLEHPGVAEAVVLGAPEAIYGERVCAVLRPRVTAQDGKGAAASPGSSSETEALELHALRSWLKPRLPDYKIPSRLILLPEGGEIPKNAMGKVNKKALLSQLEGLEGAVDTST